MTSSQFGVIAVYVAIAVWLILTIIGHRKQSYRLSLIFGIGLMLALNVRYLIDGHAASIAFFVSIYDVFDNLGLSAGQGAPALASCAGNECSVWGERYLNHPSWGVAFYERFANSSLLRSNLLYGHIIFNSIVFVSMHVQIASPGSGNNKRLHRYLGRFSFVCLTIATICAVWLAAEHSTVDEYGGALSMFGFWFMSACVYGCAVVGILFIRRGDAAAHRIWMWRFAGSMWGSFWLFRLMLIFTGPLLRNWDAASLLLSIWLSAPFGILLAEVMRRWLDRQPAELLPSSTTANASVGAD